MHFRLTNEFIGECKRVLTWKLVTVETSAKESTSRLCKLEKDLEKVEDKRKMVNIKFVHNIVHIICLAMNIFISLLMLIVRLVIQENAWLGGST